MRVKMTPLSQTSFSTEQNQTILLYERSYVPARSLSTTLSVCLSMDSIFFDIFDANKEKRVKYLIIRDRLFQVSSTVLLTVQSHKSFEIYRNKRFSQLHQVLRSDYYFHVKALYKYVHEFDSAYNQLED